MTCEPCTYSQEPEGDYLQTSFWDMTQSSQSSGSHTPARSCENEQQKDGSPTCQCGKGTSGCSIHPNTPEKWIASMRDSLAKICRSLESNLAWAMTQEAVFTGKSSELLALFDPDTCSLRMSQQSLLMDSNTSYQTWPRSGMTVDGRVYALPNAAPITEEIDGGCLHKIPTPLAADGTAVGGLDRLRGNAKCWNLRDWYHQQMKSHYQHGQSPARARNARFWEWLMGWPDNWTASIAAETDKSRCKPQLPGNCSEANDIPQA